MNPSLSGKNVLVVGLGRSGLSAAEFASKKGAKVKVSDKRCQRELEKEIQFLQDRGIEYEVGGHSVEAFLSADIIVVSPGVPSKIAELREAIQVGREVVGEVELASRFLQGKIIGITGSNGKTTTTALVGEILRLAGLRVQVGGNIGTPLTSLVDPSTPETVNVIELSSFQLEAIPTFRPGSAVLLNITPDHLDRYDSFEDYAKAKLNIFKNQKHSDFAVLNYDDELVRHSAESIGSTIFWFSTRNKVEQGTYFDGRQLIFRFGEQEETVISREFILLRGRHNLENISAAITAARLVNVATSKVGEAIAQFKGVEHRLELIAEISGVTFYNDSKATNTDATKMALEAFDSGVHLILGGRDKGSDFTVLSRLIRERVRSVVLLGEASLKIKHELAGLVPMFQARSMEEAARLAFGQARNGEIVLLAPACASFDMFQNYEHRGREFKEAVRELNKG
jgi:UDP-N-acetylmuramoylalanine--D-glutamate ligase